MIFQVAQLLALQKVKQAVVQVIKNKSEMLRIVNHLLIVLDDMSNKMQDVLKVCL